MLADAVMAFEEIDFSAMEKEEAAKYITGMEVNQDASQLIFVPSAHNGPYLGAFQFKNTQGINSSARLSKDTDIHDPGLNRSKN